MKRTQNKDIIKKFLEDRKRTVTAYVMKDDFDAAIAYCDRWNIRRPRDIRVFKLGMLKMALSCTDIPEEVKSEAKRKIAEFRKGLEGDRMRGLR